MKAGYARSIFGVTVLRFSRCCRSEKVPVASTRIADQQFAVERAGEIHRVEQDRERRRICRRRCGNRAGACRLRDTAWTRMPSHFHSAA